MHAMEEPDWCSFFMTGGEDDEDELDEDGVVFYSREGRLDENGN